MKSKLTVWAAMLAVVLCMASCSSTDEPDNTAYFLDIVTYEADGANGSTFTFRHQGDSELITLTCPQRLSPADFKVGSRIIINYTPESGKQYVSGPVNLAAAANVEGAGEAVASATTTETNNWVSDELSMLALFRSGEYVNVQFSAALGAQTAKVKLVVDSETLDSETPELHLIYGPYTGTVDRTYVFYGSWSIADIWNRSTCKGIRVFFNGIGSMGNSVYISKTDSDTPVRPTDPAEVQ